MRIIEAIVTLLAAAGLGHHLTLSWLGGRVSPRSFSLTRLVLTLCFAGAALDHQHPWIYALFLGLLVGNLLAGEPHS